ncbi:hypothetical protein GCM10010174_53110 [Kutzneria viridogrisea]|uniref:Uncharacterized protein n=2 Tax=Kutzneria TaxID=43356 RepID=W5WLH6_9PSEU|nr:hypothetical protein [Kutzneria albida]AHI01678.1 hypothetical protein KALB_8321 [Kutzneria albida DSM 43870]MBA8931641.1 hypothetical protein [Kutzneria viridogrisea]
MVYLLALIGAITVGVLLWRAFGPDQVRVGSRTSRSVAPDDDPDFLRKLGEQTRRDKDGPDSAP